MSCNEAVIARLVAPTVWLVAAAAAGGCDGASQVASRTEAALREHSQVQSKAGTLRALEIARRAHDVADSMAEPVEPACRLGLPGEGPWTYQFELDVERRASQRSAKSADATPVMRWHETRSLRRDAAGNLAVTMRADFRSPLGLEGRRAPAWRVVEGVSYLSMDGSRYYRRQSSTGARARLVETTRATVQMLLDAVAIGWKRRADHGWGIGGRRLVCTSAKAGNRGWLRRFASRAAAVSGQLSVDRRHGGARDLDVRWRLDDQTVLAVQFRDTLVLEAETIEAPDAAKVDTVERDRSIEGVHTLMDTLGRRGWIRGRQPPSSAGSSDQLGSSEHAPARGNDDAK